jgi:hypothetical protein
VGPSRDEAHCARRIPIKATKDPGSIPGTSTEKARGYQAVPTDM